MDKPQIDRPVTIRDIAKRANTSIAAVSRVIGNSGYPISEVTRQRVLNAIKDLNYTPNLLGRTRKKTEVKEIDVIVPPIQNSFYIKVLIDIESEAKNSYDILFYNSIRNINYERKNIRQLAQKWKNLIIQWRTQNLLFRLTHPLLYETR